MLTSKVFQCYALSPVMPFSIQIIHIKSLFPTNLAIACPWDGLSMVFSFDVHWTTDAFHALKIILFVFEQCSVVKTLNFRRILLDIRYMQRRHQHMFDPYSMTILLDWIRVNCCCSSKNIQSFYVVWLFLCVCLIGNGNIAGVRIFLFIISLVK